MSIPPPPGPQQPQDPYRPPQSQGPYAARPQGPVPGAPQGPYGGPPYPMWGQGFLPLNRPAPVNGVAIAALVLGVLCFLPAVGLVLGVIALVQIRRRGERGRGMAIAGTVLSSLGLALWVVMLATGGASAVWEGFKEGANGNSALSLAEGDCFDVPGDTFREDVYDVDEVPCAEEHDGEVFGTIPLPGNDYPGDDQVGDTAEDQCWRLRDGYAMDPWALGDDVDVYYLTPTRESWRWGDREITCVFADADERGTLTGSLRADETTLDADQLAFLKAMAAVDEALYEEPEEYAEEDLDVNRTWAGETGDVTGEQAEALGGHTWPAGARAPLAALVKDMRDASAEWTKAADASDPDAFYEHYDNAYDYVDGASTVTAREALGLATTPPTYDEDADSGSGGGDEGGLDV
ncbi:DUF4190 domain-containing protein [Streptomyces sp. NPDC017936]|uniref:DUF4190 domain-containing protein n=1 Tax=Streptomyces sp. NPDC017936 TaxID=3365016 RepID=UPI00379AFE13